MQFWHSIRTNLCAAFLIFLSSLASGQSVQSKRFQACTACHGSEASEGQSANRQYFPRIAGKPVGYLYNQLLNFRDGRRHSGLMVSMVTNLSDAYLLEMAQYFADLDLPYPAVEITQADAPPTTVALGRNLVKEGDQARNIPACVACHGNALMGVAPKLIAGKTEQPSMPALLGLPRDYVVSQLGAWKTGLRRTHDPDCMSLIAKRLTASDIEAIATWLSAQPVPTAVQSGSKPANHLVAAMPEKCGGVK